MGTLKSKVDWSGREVNGVILGQPVVDETTGDFIWDHPSISGDMIDSEGDIYAEVPIEN